MSDINDVTQIQAQTAAFEKLDSAQDAQAAKEATGSFEEMMASMRAAQEKLEKKHAKVKKTMHQRVEGATRPPEKSGETQKQAPSKREQSFNNWFARNPTLGREVNKEKLFTLREKITADSSPEEILSMVEELAEDDPALADAIFDFLAEDSEGGLNEVIKDLHSDYYEKNEEAILLGKSMTPFLHGVGAIGRGRASRMRQLYLYREMATAALYDALVREFGLQNLRETLMELLMRIREEIRPEEYEEDEDEEEEKGEDEEENEEGAEKKPKKKRKVIAHFHLEPSHLRTLMIKTRQLQAISGGLNYFHGRMGIVKSTYQKLKMSRPSDFNYETLTSKFISMAGNRSISEAQISLQAGILAGHPESPELKALVIEQWIAAIQESSDELYPQGRAQKMTLLETLKRAATTQYELMGEEEEEPPETGDTYRPDLL